MDNYRPAWIEVNLNAIEKNLALARKITPKNTKVLAVVKADAYGHGAVPVAKKLCNCGVDYLAVASIEEAQELRNAKIRSPILILGVVHPSQLKDALKLNLTLTLFTKTMIKALSKQAKTQNKIVPVHIKIDTGMGRLGVWFEDAMDFIIEAAASRNLKLEGIFTHLSAADEDREYTLSQLSHFNKLIANLDERGIRILFKHAANSMGTLGYKQAHFNMIRPGLMLYGLYPDNNTKKQHMLFPAMSFKARVVWLKETPKGRYISYGHTYVTQKNTMLASIPVGYSHGYPRTLSNKAHVLIGGKRAPVAGRICMDQTMVDVGLLKTVKLGDEVCLLGEQKNDKITAEYLADLCGTISYEIVCWISRRVPRIYKSASCGR
ncbi:MAG: alanine racemase [Candidatus Omnitrophota bacterium]